MPRPVAQISQTGAFASQVMQGGSFLDAQNNDANIDTSVNAPALRISDDYQMAIEDSDLQNRQPKTFFASDSVLANSRTGMAKSSFELIKGAATLTLWKENNQQVVLSSVFPQEKGAPLQNPLDLKTAQNCQAISGLVVGGNQRATESTFSASFTAHHPTASTSVGDAVHLEAAALVAALTGTSGGDRMGQLRAIPEFSDHPVQDAQRSGQIVNQIAQEYVHALQQGGEAITRHLKALQMNQYAAPGVGEAFVIATTAHPDVTGQVTDIATGTQLAPQWPYHFGGVVAKSGDDVVTLENYARGGEAQRAHSNANADPRWYFQMYGMKVGQSFHEAHTASGEYANPQTLTLRDPARMQEEKRAKEREAFTRKVQYGAATVAFGILAIGLAVFSKLNRT